MFLKVCQFYVCVFLPVLQKKASFMISVCVPALQIPSTIGATLKGKNSLPKGANSFLLSVAPKVMENEFFWARITSLTSVPMHFNDLDWKLVLGTYATSAGQFRCRRLQCLVKVSTISLQEFLYKIHVQ